MKAAVGRPRPATSHAPPPRSPSYQLHSSSESRPTSGYFKPTAHGSMVRRVDASPLIEQPPQPAPAPRAGRSLHRFANPGRFLRLSGALLPWLAVPGAVLLATGLIWGLLFAPAD